MQKKNFIGGFTLIELMVVILIIVILGTLGLVSYSQATRSARDGKRKADIESIRQAMVLYRQDTGLAYPSALSTLVSAGFLSAPEPDDPDPALSYTVTGGATFCVCADVTDPAKGNNASGTDCTTITTSGSFYCARQP